MQCNALCAGTNNGPPLFEKVWFCCILFMLYAATYLVSRGVKIRLLEKPGSFFSRRRSEGLLGGCAVCSSTVCAVCNFGGCAATAAQWQQQRLLSRGEGWRAFLTLQVEQFLQNPSTSERNAPVRRHLHQLTLWWATTIFCNVSKNPQKISGRNPKTIQGEIQKEEYTSTCTTLLSDEQPVHHHTLPWNNSLYAMICASFHLHCCGLK